MPVAPHVERLIIERRDLAIRMDKLKAFIGTDTFNTLPVEEQVDMRYQLLIMDVYSDILGRRITRVTTSW
jgi:hypothetical protein